MHDVPVAVFDKSVPDDVSDMLSVRYGQQMTLTLAIDDFQQVVVTEPGGLGEDRSGYLDGVIRTERLDDGDGSVRDGSQPVGQLCAHLGFNSAAQPSDDIIEQCNVLFRVGTRSTHEQVSDPPQHFNPSIRNAALERLLKFGNKC